MWFVYILLCSNGEYYKGCTSNLDGRELISYTAFTDKYRAYEFEKYLKSGSGRAFLKKHLV